MLNERTKHGFWLVLLEYVLILEATSDYNCADIIGFCAHCEKALFARAQQGISAYFSLKMTSPLPIGWSFNQRRYL